MVYEGEEPMIGLDQLTELVKEDDEHPTYQCDVCNTVLNHGNLYSHVSGVKHRHNYVTMFHPELKDELKKQHKEEKEAMKEASGEDTENQGQKTAHERSLIMREIAFKVESLTGRKKMKREFVKSDKPKKPKKEVSSINMRGGQPRGGARGGGGRGSTGRGGGGHGGGGRGGGGRGRGGRGGRGAGGAGGGWGGQGPWGDDYGGYGGDHGYGGDGYGDDGYAGGYLDEYLSRPPRDPRDAIRARMRRPSASGYDDYGDYDRPLPRRRPYPSNYEDDFYENEYSRRPDMDFGSMRTPPKRKEESGDASDAFILAEFEKRFGKRIKLGDDSDTLVLGSSKGKPKDPPSLHGKSMGGSSSYDSYGGGSMYGGGSSSYGGGSSSFSKDSYGGGGYGYGGY